MSRRPCARPCRRRRAARSRSRRSHAGRREDAPASATRAGARRPDCHSETVCAPMIARVKASDRSSAVSHVQEFTLGAPLEHPREQQATEQRTGDPPSSIRSSRRDPAARPGAGWRLREAPTASRRHTRARSAPPARLDVRRAARPPSGARVLRAGADGGLGWQAIESLLDCSEYFAGLLAHPQHVRPLATSVDPRPLTCYRPQPPLGLAGHGQPGCARRGAAQTPAALLPSGGVEHRLARCARDRARLDAAVFRLPVERIRAGYYSDAYFVHTKRLLEARGPPPASDRCRCSRRRSRCSAASTRRSRS